MRSFLRAGLTALGLWVLSTVAAFAICGAAAGGCFWVPLAVSGAVSGTGSVCRLTVLNTAGLVSGTSVIVAGLVGATECNGTTTVSTVVDGTHLELAGTTFTSVYVSGGTVAGEMCIRDSRPGAAAVHPARLRRGRIELHGTHADRVHQPRRHVRPVELGAIRGELLIETGLAFVPVSCPPGQQQASRQVLNSATV